MGILHEFIQLSINCHIGILAHWLIKKISPPVETAGLKVMVLIKKV
jgi:hypothetical protein